MADFETGLGHLPNEILENILSQLPKRSLLTCRLVCSLWETFASRILRQRGLELRLCWSLFRCSIGSNDLIQLFENSKTVFWSACAIQPWKAPKMLRVVCEEYLALQKAEKFFERFGMYFRKAEIRGDYFDAVFIILKSLPNLESLTFIQTECNQADDDFDFDIILPPILNLKLLNLKRLEIEIDGVKRYSLLKLIITKSGAVIELLNLIFYSYFEEEEEYAEDLANLIIGITSIHVCFCNTQSAEGMIKALSKKSLRITELSLNIEDIGPGHFYTEFFPILENFLISISAYLKKLSISDGAWPGPMVFPVALVLPYFPALTEIKLNSHALEPTIQNLPFLLPLSPHHLPRLARVTFLNINGNPLLFSNNAGAFSSVKELESSQTKRPLARNLNSVFPNLKKLILKSGVYTEDLRYILAHMTNLERLGLKILKEEGEDLNETFKGFAKSDTKDSSSFASMKRLKELLFTFPEEAKLQDRGVCPSLLETPPLACLCLQNVDISQESTTLLHNYHAQVYVNVVPPESCRVFTLD